MATIAVGNGLFKANPSSLLSTCYDKNDPRLDGAFTMYYMSINIGSFFSMLATPWLAARFGWSVAFALSVVGMVITIINFAFCQKWVKQYGSKPDFAPVHMGKLLATIAGVVVLVAIATWLLHNQGIARMALGVIALGIVVIFAKEAMGLKGAASQNDRRLPADGRSDRLLRTVQPDADLSELLCYPQRGALDPRPRLRAGTVSGAEPVLDHDW